MYAFDDNDWEMISPKVVNSTSENSKSQNNAPSFHCCRPQGSQDGGAARDAIYIFADLLIPGKGKPIPNQAVIAAKGRIVFIGPPSEVPTIYHDLTPTHVAYLLPGLWESHAHFMGPSPTAPITVGTLLVTPPAEAGARASRQVRDTLYAGFTSCIELGGYGAELQKVIDDGSILGPTIYSAGALITMTAGHGDAFDLPVGQVWRQSKPGYDGPDMSPQPTLMADGPDECRKAVRLNLRRGAKLIKVLTSGGVTSRDDNPLYQQFSDEELKVIVDEAKRMGLSCSAHAIGKAGIMAAIRAGFKAIHHNTFADDEVIAAMKLHNVIGVHTITPMQSILDNKDKYPPRMYEKNAKVAAIGKANYARAIKSGATIALGSDLFGGPGSVLAPGMNGREVVYAVAAGMTPLEAIEAGTANGPLILGAQAPKSGQIKVDYDADFIALDENPLENIELFKTPKNITRIWKGGKLVKAPGLDPYDIM